MTDLIEQLLELAERQFHHRPKQHALLTGVAAALQALEARVAELEGERPPGIYRPGVLRCAKCDCRLISSTLHVRSGTITPSYTTEHCPNDGAPMWRVSWEDECRVADRLWDEYLTRAQSAEARNRVLVEALEPFAKAFAETFEFGKKGLNSLAELHLLASYRIAWPDFRRASEALAKTKDQEVSVADIAARGTTASRSDGQGKSDGGG